VQKTLTAILSLALVAVCVAACVPSGAQPQKPAPAFPVVGTVPLKIEGKVVSFIKEVPFKVHAGEGGDFYFWTFPDSFKAEHNYESTLTVTAAPKGTFTIRVLKVTFNPNSAKKFDKDTGEIEVTVGESPVPPGPGPEPQPPGPTPGPAPIPAEGLHVLIVYESAEKNKMPPAQLLVLHAQPIRDYLNAKCPAGPIAGQKEWWILDKDTDVSALPQKWQDAMKRPRQSVPWIIVSNGKAGFEGPLPADVNKTLELLRKYGG
jgi:hypothetical protein